MATSTLDSSRQPALSLTEATLPPQSGRVFIVTGGSNGLGYELSRILYGAGGKVYILTRSKERAESAIARIKAHYRDEKEGVQDAGRQRGSLAFIHLDLMDFGSVKKAALEFLEREKGPEGRLDILSFNNAGTGGRKNAPAGQQGHEYHFTTNTMGPFLLTRLLTPVLSSTARRSPPGSVRPPPDGVRKEFLQAPNPSVISAKDAMDYKELYSQSKAACWFIASEFARRYAETTGYTPNLLYFCVRPVLRNPSPVGAHTYLWMGFSDSVTLADAAEGRYATCDGRWHPGQREDLVLAQRKVDEGGSGRASEVFDWCEEKVAEFLN
ncbi:NAD(P)-binding protein [Cryphonectria parasitica EP155]|uniref:NAD(P)-binding protein n=1 Tax=Cryphonectria parasitica (strain ATCC 38755 / EP155) TaxID=660469 RepID=A0A9P4Y663_CRYP1|nr:NAD(P)-binding protein [Cryphonectria parasitica EP155]KAF3766815.1 NAD(P)-binding protein [Cryphonectria parasitica EP155]